MRRHFRRVAALVSGVFLLQLVLVGSGFACALPMSMAGTQASATTTSPAMSNMAGMNMPGAQQSQTPSKAPRSDSPCRLPWAPVGCQSMTPCSPVAIGESPTVASLRPLGAYSVAALNVVTPPSRTTPPELPPPKA